MIAARMQASLVARMQASHAPSDQSKGLEGHGNLLRQNDLDNGVDVNRLIADGSRERPRVDGESAGLGSPGGTDESREGGDRAGTPATSSHAHVAPSSSRGAVQRPLNESLPGVTSASGSQGVSQLEYDRLNAAHLRLQADYGALLREANGWAHHNASLSQQNKAFQSIIEYLRDVNSQLSSNNLAQRHMHALHRNEALAKAVQEQLEEITQLKATVSRLER